MVRRAVCPEFTADDHERITTTPPPSLDFRVVRLRWTWKTGLIKTAQIIDNGYSARQRLHLVSTYFFFAKLDWYNSLWHLVDVQCNFVIICSKYTVGTTICFLKTRYMTAIFFDIAGFQKLYMMHMISILTLKSTLVSLITKLIYFGEVVHNWITVDSRYSGSPKKSAISSFSAIRNYFCFIKSILVVGKKSAI